MTLRKELIRLAHQNPELRRHLLPLLRQAGDSSALVEALRSLAMLKELDQNLTEVEQTFSLHYRTAVEVHPEVVSQIETLQKARKGLQGADATVKSLEDLAVLFPEDKTVQRALTDAKTLVKRFTKHVDEAKKIISTLSKKTLPPTLKATASKLEKALKAVLVNPDQLEVLPWQRGHALYQSYGGTLQGVLFYVIFRVSKVKENRDLTLILAESTISQSAGLWLSDNQEGLGYVGSSVSTGIRKFDTIARAVEMFRELGAGWTGLKGESEANANRLSEANAVGAALQSALNRVRAYMKENVEISTDGRELVGAYRSDLPKEGASDVGESRYEEMVADEIERWHKILDPLLKPYQGSIKRIEVQDEEKSWIYTRILLK